MMPAWAWWYFAFVAGMYAIIATLRIMAWRHEVAWEARRRAMFAELRAAGYYDVKPPKPPEPPRRRWFDTDGVEIFED